MLTLYQQDICIQIIRKKGIVGQEAHLLCLCLGYEQPVERVFMHRRSLGPPQRFKGKNVTNVCLGKPKSRLQTQLIKAWRFPIRKRN